MIPRPKTGFNLVRTTVRLPKKLMDAAKIHGILEGLSLQDIITVAVQQYLDKKGRK